jgi:GNAT superfamily N-acetyltransferase
MARETERKHGLPPAHLDRLSLADISDELLSELKVPLSNAYHNAHMFADLLEDIDYQPNVFQLFAARLNDPPNKLVGVSVVESKPHDFIDYLGFDPVHIKRFTVLPEFRGMGIGKQLLDESKQYGFEDSGLQALFGESYELGALALYGREGALYHMDSIRSSLRRTDPESNVDYFVKFITDPAFRGFRYRLVMAFRSFIARTTKRLRFFKLMDMYLWASCLQPNKLQVSR